MHTHTEHGVYGDCIITQISIAEQAVLWLMQSPCVKTSVRYYNV